MNFVKSLVTSMPNRFKKEEQDQIKIKDDNTCQQSLQHLCGSQLTMLCLQISTQSIQATPKEDFHKQLNQGYIVK